MDTIASIRKFGQRLASTVLRGIIARVDDSQATQTIQVELRFDEIAEAVELFQPFGLSFRPTVDSEVIVLSVGSSQDNLVALAATDRAIRPTGIEEGEGGLYTPSGWKVFCDAEGNVSLAAKDPAGGIPRDDRVEREIKKIRDAILNAKAGTGTPDSGSALLTSMQGLLNTSPAEPTKSDKGKVT